MKKLRNASGQSVIEYSLLVVICIIALIGLGFIVNLTNNKSGGSSAFRDHFYTVVHVISPMTGVIGQQ